MIKMKCYIDILLIIMHIALRNTYIYTNIIDTKHFKHIKQDFIRSYLQISLSLKYIHVEVVVVVFDFMVLQAIVA